MIDLLPELLDNRRLREEMGITKAAAEKIIRACPVVRFPDLDKLYVKRADVLRLIEEGSSPGHWRFEKTGVRL